MRHARLVESQAGIKTGGKNNSNLRYADNTTLMAGKKKKNNNSKNSRILLGASENN